MQKKDAVQILELSYFEHIHVRAWRERIYCFENRYNSDMWLMSHSSSFLMSNGLQLKILILILMVPYLLSVNVSENSFSHT